ncbi:Phage shock protein PspC (stress-responsive transcriptional regulator) [Flexibacter flexilis DSM 6793]|uniref:Phage shock protein PspC (Stress-responsive transcriptional regulator) n=1 Tax=Flexibacter flexilis DSM 6793 TaxID=927664 RepID=A0A1I1E8H9_9BACT|nr:PspC domain-containing protein [Flexibacter flexilis]SFB81253.1 Phage shock protein PspC (stress-responsive transcriptional regulator) [Flexibacter flexilis DSM 6793]
MTKKIQIFCEKQAFGVCARLGDYMGISSGGIRLFFVYTSFLTMGSPVILYLILAFVMDMRKHFRRGNSSIWDF